MLCLDRGMNGYFTELCCAHNKGEEEGDLLLSRASSFREHADFTLFASKCTNKESLDAKRSNKDQEVALKC